MVKGEPEMEQDRELKNDAAAGSPEPKPAVATEESRRALLNKIARYGAYTPPALMAALKVVNPIPSGKFL